jgi:type IV pilus biogenesis protein CpaD/CtpE
MKPSIAELEAKARAVQCRFDILRLKEEITALLTSPEAKDLTQAERDRLEDLLARLLAKEEQFRGCDPWRVILRPPLK